MTFGERLYQLRKQRYISQEELADIMNVTRQSISKWELDQTYPDIDNLVALAKYFDVSVDFLVTGEEKPTVNEQAKDDIPKQNEEEQNERTTYANNSLAAWHYEYKSKKTYKGIPIVHVNVGIGLYCAKGIIAIGNIAKGVIAIGGLSFGIISVGGLALGLLAVGGLAVGLLLAIGGFAIGALVAAGGIAVGTYAVGGIAIGFYKALGGIAVAKHPFGALNFYLECKNSCLPLLKLF